MATTRKTTDAKTKDVATEAPSTLKGATFQEAADDATPAPDEPSKGLTVAEVIAGPAPDDRPGLPDHSHDIDPDDPEDNPPTPVAEPDQEK